MQPRYSVSADDIAGYQRDGFVILRNVLTRDEVESIRQVLLARVDQQIRSQRPMNERDTYGKAFVQIMRLWGKFPELREISLSPLFGRIVADLFQTDAVRLMQDQVLFKEPGGGPTPWHQDQYYIPFDTDRVLTMWMPLVDVSADMGTMSFAAGSHGAEMLFDKPTSDATQGHFDQIIAERTWRVVPTGDLRAGDLSFHAGWTIHGTGPNRTDRMREVFNLVYFADGARIIERGAWQGAIRGHLGDRTPGQKADSDVNPVVFRR